MVLETAADLGLAVDLEPALWVASSAPVPGIRGDVRFLEELDSDKDRRITFADLIDAIRWTLQIFKQHDGIEQGSDTLHPESIDTTTAQGERILTSLERAQARSGLEPNDPVPLETLSDALRETESRPVSEAGVILPEAAEDNETAEFIRVAIRVTGGVPHPGGSRGIDSESLTQFRQCLHAYLNWSGYGSNDPNSSAGEPPPADTADNPILFRCTIEDEANYRRYAELIEKIDRYFMLCDAAKIDNRLEGFSHGQELSIESLVTGDSGSIEAALRAAPIAGITRTGILPGPDEVNPLYKEPLESFQREILEPRTGLSVFSLPVDRWRDLRRWMKPFEQWLSLKPHGAYELSAVDEPGSLLDPSLQTACETLIEHSRDMAYDRGNLRLAVRAGLFQAFLLEFCNNFISFPRLYNRRSRAVFEQGRLILDGRVFNLVVKVDNRGKHATLARNSDMFVMYLVVYGTDGNRAFEIAVPVTSGGRGNITVGKRGVFVDLDDRDMDAEVVELIENPIGFIEAIVSPFKRLWRVVTGKLDAMTVTAQTELEQAASREFDTVAAGTTAGSGSGVPAGQVAAAGSPSGNRGTISPAGSLLLGGGVALAALGSALVYITDTLASLRWWQILVGLGSALFAVVFPAIIQAFIKLRRRDLSPIIEACGWAINARMRLTRSLCRSFTYRPRYPRKPRHCK